METGGYFTMEREQKLTRMKVKSMDPRASTAYKEEGEVGIQ